MKKNKPRPKLVERDKIIFKEFEMLFNIKGLRMEVIYARLSVKFYLSEQSIQKIVLKTAKTIDTRQNTGKAIIG